jgi:hypothetical protein
VGISSGLTGTDFDNFFWLRHHEDAQPEILDLTRLMLFEYERSTPESLGVGQWHLPYVCTFLSGGQQVYYDEVGVGISLEQAIKISCSSCAQVSYRKLDTSLEKAEHIYKRLVDSEPVHASAFEHAAVSKGYVTDPLAGWTHKDFNENYYSGNFKNWVQYRQVIPNHSKAYSGCGKEYFKGDKNTIINKGE